VNLQPATMTKTKKRLGQHFLIDQRVVARIVDAVAPERSDAIIEIGPGTGAITRPLAARAGYLAAIEADSGLVAELNAGFESDNVSIIQGDALAVDWDTLIDSTVQAWRARFSEPGRAPRVRIVANLPYYISTAILQVLIAHRARMFDITVMLQDEVVDRIAGSSGNRDYGYLSVLTQFYCEVQKLFETPPSAFKPPPEVKSAVVRLTVRQQPAVAVENEERYFAVVRAAFAQRRKTILNNLKAALGTLGPARQPGDALAHAGIDPRRRAETLSLEDFASLCDSLYGR
jgi:16S rRNA (adenine1518-N6/adenine1519-N6)-dimethyltransferase